MIELERTGSVFVLHMRAGENRMGAAFVEAFHTALDTVEAHAGEAALVTVGEGRFYSNGLDLDEMLSAPATEVGTTMAGVHRLLGRVLAFPAFTVAAVNGHAFGAGAMLVAAHDHAVMRADRGYWCLPEVDLASGGPMSPGMTELLRARLAPATFHEACVTGRRYAAEDAQRAGVVGAVRDEADVLPEAIEHAATFAAKHRPTIGALKHGMYGRALDALAAPAAGSRDDLDDLAGIAARGGTARRDP